MSRPPLPPTDQAFVDAIRKYCLAAVTVTFETYGTPIVQTTMRRSGRMWVMGTGGDFLGALTSTTKIIEKVIALEKVLGHPIKSPLLSSQQYDNGYFRQFIYQDQEVEFKRQGDRFVITNIKRQDSEGFYLVEEPFPVGEDMQLVGYREDGCALYTWNNIRFFSGSAGEAIVKDGKVIKTRMTMIA